MNVEVAIELDNLTSIKIKSYGTYVNLYMGSPGR